MNAYIGNNINAIAHNVSRAHPAQRWTFLGLSVATHAAVSALVTRSLISNGADLAKLMCYNPSEEFCAATVTIIFAAAPILVSTMASVVFYKCIIPIPHAD